MYVGVWIGGICVFVGVDVAGMLVIVWEIFCVNEVAGRIGESCWLDGSKVRQLMLRIVSIDSIISIRLFMIAVEND